MIKLFSICLITVEEDIPHSHEEWSTLHYMQLDNTHPIIYETTLIQGVSRGIVNILGGGSMDYSE
jgi:hypothetical protein